jgi:hypothetical protein
MDPIKQKDEKTRKILHDLRSHLSVIMSMGELALYDKQAVTKEEAVSVIEKTLAEVDEILKLIEEI